MGCSVLHQCNLFLCCLSKNERSIYRSERVLCASCTTNLNCAIPQDSGQNTLAYLNPFDLSQQHFKRVSTDEANFCNNTLVSYSILRRFEIDKREEER